MTDEKLIKGSVFYYDNSYNKETMRNVIEILRTYNMYPSQDYYFTDEKRIHHKKVTNTSTNEIIEAYEKQGVFTIELINESDDDNVFMDIFLSMTFYKAKYNFSEESAIKPWNVFSITFKHRKMQDIEKQKEFVNCIKDLIIEFDAFYAQIDDIGTDLKLSHNKPFNPKKIEAVHWANYWGMMYKDKNIYDILDEASVNSEMINEGVFCLLSNNMLDYDSRQVNKARKKILKMIDRKSVFHF